MRASKKWRNILGEEIQTTIFATSKLQRAKIHAKKKITSRNSSAIIIHVIFSTISSRLCCVSIFFFSREKNSLSLTFTAES